MPIPTAPNPLPRPNLLRMAGAAESRSHLRRTPGFLRVMRLLLLMICPGGFAVAAIGAEREFTIAGVPMILRDVSSEVDVFFYSMRLDRGVNLWRVEVSVTNRSAAILGGPIVLMIESMTGVSGMYQADGYTTDSPSLAYYDLTSRLPGPALPVGSGTLRRTLSMPFGVGSPKLVARVFAGAAETAPLGLTRTLDGLGQPLPNVEVTGTGPQGALLQSSDGVSGSVSLGHGPGDYDLRFSLQDHLTAVRRASVGPSGVTLIPYPRLTVRNRHPVQLTPLGGIVLSNTAGDVRLELPSGAVSESTTMHLTSLDGQSLPGLLPAGWSPVQAFWLESSRPVNRELPVRISPWSPMHPGESGWLAVWDESPGRWRALAAMPGAGSNTVSASVPGPGVYAWVVADIGASAPPAPQPTNLLEGADINPPALEPMTATGAVSPASSPASTVPERVTSTAHVVFEHGVEALPSGTLFRSRMTESYWLKDSGRRITPNYDQFIVGYQRPSDGNERTLAADFPMRPLLLFGTDWLQEAKVRVDVLADVAFEGTVLGPKGGAAAQDAIQILAPAGGFARPAGLLLETLSKVPYLPLASQGLSIVSAFELTFDNSGLTGPLALQASGLGSNQWYVLARAVLSEELFGLEPVARLRTDGEGRLRSQEPSTAPALPGMRGSGQYVLVRSDVPHALVSGATRNATGAAPMPVMVEGTPWLTLSGADGRYVLIAPTGESSLLAIDPASSDPGRGTVIVDAGSQHVGLDLIPAPTGPSVRSITPRDGASRVELLTSVTIQFSEPVNPATLVGDGVQLIGTNGVPVAAALSLDSRRVRAVLTPATSLDPGVSYRVVLAPGIMDSTGLSLAGRREFQFTTLSAARGDITPAQLVIYEPGATNVPGPVLAQIPAYTAGTIPDAVVVRGTPGTADPEVAVVLVNESTGETATVLSKLDGSFSSVISGREDDFISATFVNLSGTRIYVPVSRQEFDDGFVGLYRQGGILEAQSDGGPVQVLIEPQAVLTKTKFRTKTLSAAKLKQQLGGLEPEDARYAGTSVELETQGEPLQGPVKVKFNIDLRAAGFPTNADPREAALALARVTEAQDVTAFEVLDQLKFTPTPPPPPGLPRQADATDGEQLTYGIVESVVGFVPGAEQASGVFKYLFVPLLIGGKPIVVKGIVAQSLEVEKLQNPLSTAANDLLPSAVGQGISNVDTIVNTANTLVETAMDLSFGKRLGGAFISFQNIRTPALPGRLRHGMIYSTSDRHGQYLMVVPTTPFFNFSPDNFYLLIASHPKFEDTQSEGLFALMDISIAGVVFKSFVFRKPLPFTSPPAVNIAHTPPFPAPGEPVEIQINASQGFAGAPRVNLFIESVTPTNRTAADVRIYDVTETALGGGRTRWAGKLQASNQVQTVSLRVSAVSASGTVIPRLPYILSFSGEPARPNEPIPVSDPTEKLGPQVVLTLPQEGSYVQESADITLVFNEPISASTATNLAGIRLAGPSGGLPAPSIQLSPGQTELLIHFAGLTPGADYSLTLSGASIQDLSGNPLDQYPSTREAESFTLNFKTSPIPSIPIPGVVNGKGSAISGTRLYVLDAGAENLLRTFDISVPQRPRQLSTVRLVGVPRDLAVIPNYSHRRTLHGPVMTSELVAVVSGDLDIVVDHLDSVIVRGQQMRILDMGDPANPVEIAAPVLTKRASSVIPKLRWFPPDLVYQEFSVEFHQLAWVDLQELLIGFNATRPEIDVFPDGGKPGLDANGDGDYVDEGVDANNDGDLSDPGDTKADTLPLPQRRPAEFFGRKQSLLLEGTSQKLIDWSVSGGTVGAVLSGGFELNNNGKPTSVRRHPEYRTLNFNGFDVNPSAASQRVPEGAYPGRVTIIEGLPIEISGQLRTPIVAIVSLAPNAEGRQSLLLIDISQPESPRILNEVLIPDAAAGGLIESIQMRPDGLLELTTSSHVVLLDSIRLGDPNPPGGASHPSITGFIPGAGAKTRSVATSGAGLRAVAEAGRNQLILTPPTLLFVSFPTSTNGLIDPRHLPASEDALTALLGIAVQTPGLSPARVRPGMGQISQLFPADPSVHYHVLTEVAGGAGERILLGLESLSPAGWPLPPKGAGFAPVKAVETRTLDALDIQLRASCDASVQPLVAYRMSANPRSAFYNRYLSRPFVVVYETLTVSEVNSQRLQADRDILWSGGQLRAFIDPSEFGNTVLAPFAARIDTDRKRLLPVASTMIPTLESAFIPGPNPPPLGGADGFSGTFESVMGHSAEFRTETEDITLPSPRMPISIHRTAGGQDYYDGPFGMGWDFNYNQRITLLNTTVFPAGQRMPLIERGTEDDSVVAGSKDALLHTGGGRVVHFDWKGVDMPDEYKRDPLVLESRYAETVSDYFLPEPGSFDLLVRFRDAKWERLTPDGTRFQYDAVGRLQTITDRFPGNRHALQRDAHGWLTRIDDRSVTADRYLEFGYHRREHDREFRSGLDERTENCFHEGRICRIRDYTGRDILFFYDDEGLLIRREGVEVDGGAEGFGGRAQTHYFYKDCKITGVGVGREGTPLFSAETRTNAKGAPVSTKGSGISGATEFAVPENQGSDALEDSKTSVTQAGGRKVEHVHDKNGRLKERTVQGPDVPAATTRMTHNKHGQLTQLEPPEKGPETYLFDTNNLVFRSRGNLLQKTVSPGPRGGEAQVETFAYDARYNLPSGLHRNANGFTTQYHLSADGRYVKAIDHGSAGTETLDVNASGQLTSRVDHDGIANTAAFDSSTGFVRRQGRGDHEKSFSYDGSRAAALGRASSVQPPRGLPIAFKYNDALQLVETTRGDHLTRAAYNEQGKVIYELESHGDGTRLETRLQVDVRGFVTSVRQSGVEVDGTETTLEQLFEPDELFRVKSTTLPSGAVQSFLYDAQGHLKSMKLGEYAEEYRLDLHGNVIEVKKGGDVVERVDYDGMDRPKRITRLTGIAEHVIDYTYFVGGQLRTMLVRDPVHGVLQDVENLEIDELGRVKRSVVRGTQLGREDSFSYGALGKTATGPLQSIREEWDRAGYPSRWSDSLLSVQFESDGNGNLRKVVRQEDGATFSDEFDYDGLDHKISAADRLGMVAGFKPRADGRNVEEWNARNNKSVMKYSALGELLSRRRADGMEFRFKHDRQRQVSHAGDGTGQGNSFSYDGQLRLDQMTLRNGGQVRYSDFDGRNIAGTMTYPGGRTTTTHDLQQRMTSSASTFGSTTFRQSNEYDAMNRTRVSRYEQNGGPVDMATFTFDKAGPLLEANFNERGAGFKVGYSYRNDFARSAITYPSGAVVQEERDGSGRLKRLYTSLGTIASVTAWQGNIQPSRVLLGEVIQTDNQYDARGRLLSSRSVRIAGGKVLSHLRLQYDVANNVEVRQFLHRAGRADRFAYDAGERIATAEIGGIPTVSGTSLSRPRYTRTYGYSAGGLDLLESATLNATDEDTPPFAGRWSAHDGFLLPTQVDDFNRGAPDPLGRVARARLWVRDPSSTNPAARAATLAHNASGHLTHISRDDGLAVDSLYQSGGLRFHRTLRSNGATVESRHFVYDMEGRLLEEYDRGPAAPRLLARYYYFDQDAPCAADLRTSTGELERFYYLVDDVDSVIAVADRDGVVVERAWYDTHGQPRIEAPDSIAPTVKRVLAGEGGTLLIELTEPVTAVTSDPGPGVGIQRYVHSYDELMIAPTNGTSTLPIRVPGFPPYSVIVFTPSSPVTGAVDVVLAPGKLSDDWNNHVMSQRISINATGRQGDIYFAAGGNAITQPPPSARSLIGSPILFHGQYFDYETGLIYLRNRFYDPYSGMFLEPDPMGYEDSVNLYAGLRNNPVTVRDPSGLMGFKERFKNLFARRKQTPAAGTGVHLPPAAGTRNRPHPTSKESHELSGQPSDHVASAGAGSHSTHVDDLRQAQRRRFQENDELRMGATIDFKIERARLNSPGYTRTTISGHGVEAKDKTFEVPRGTTLTFWGKSELPLADSVGNMMESGAPVDAIYAHAAERKSFWEGEIRKLHRRRVLPEDELDHARGMVQMYDLPPLRVYRPGETVPDHILSEAVSQGRRLNIAPGRRITTDTPVLLSELLKPGMGEVHWAACRVRRTR